MKKRTHQFCLLFVTVLIFSGCANTQPKVSVTKNTVAWDDINQMPLVKPNLTGLWVLNTELSENSQKEFKESLQQSSSPRSNKGMNGRGGGHGGKEKGGKRCDGYSKNKKTILIMVLCRRNYKHY